MPEKIQTKSQKISAPHKIPKNSNSNFRQKYASLKKKQPNTSQQDTNQYVSRQ
jgi:hypothetical protein